MVQSFVEIFTCAHANPAALMHFSLCTFLGTQVCSGLFTLQVCKRSVESIALSFKLMCISFFIIIIIKNAALCNKCDVRKFEVQTFVVLYNFAKVISFIYFVYYCFCKNLYNILFVDC